MTKQIIANGYAYEANGTVYFDVEKFAKEYNYTALSNRNLDELLNNTRELGGQEEKKGRLDFALWIKAKPEHLMKWPSPWGVGFPGWHIECSAMSTKYLGAAFDIHGGGMDLIPTHHTNEIAQNVACHHEQPAKIWMHTNMLTVNGQKMSKSLGNSFLPGELFEGKHALLERGFSPMTVRFFMLQAHYRSTLDFSNEALKAAEKGLTRLLNAGKVLGKLTASSTSTVEVAKVKEGVYAAMNEDFNTPIAIANLFEAARLINLIHDGKEQANEIDLQDLKSLYENMVYGVLGLKDESSGGTDKMDELMQVVLKIRSEAKLRKDFYTSDQIRDQLKQIGIEIKDGKEGTSYQLD
jgi:cysteinyl-tRNA synthetase